MLKELFYSNESLEYKLDVGLVLLDQNKYWNTEITFH